MVNADSIISFLTYVSIISIGAERLTEIIKKFFIKDRTINSGWYSLISAIGGGIIATIFPPETAPFTLKYLWTMPILIGIIVSGSSGFWHEVVSSLGSVKDSLAKEKT